MIFRLESGTRLSKKLYTQKSVKECQLWPCITSRADPSWQAQIKKWYGSPSDEDTEGISLLEFACILEESGIHKYLYMIEQSVGFCDHDNLYKNPR